METFGLIFAMGSDMMDLYCVFPANDLDQARKMAQAAYPDRWTHVLPWDSRFQAHCRVYEKSEIPFGTTKELRIPPDAESLR